MGKRKLSDISDSDRSQPVPEPIKGTENAKNEVVQETEEIVSVIGNGNVQGVTVAEEITSETVAGEPAETADNKEEEADVADANTTSTEVPTVEAAEGAADKDNGDSTANETASAGTTTTETPSKAPPASIFGSSKISDSAKSFTSTPSNPFAKYSNLSFGSFTPKESPFTASFTASKPAGDTPVGANPWAEGEAKEETKPDETPIDTPTQKPDRYARVSLTAQHVENGEEEETAVFTSRARLYALSFKDTAAGWKERGVGSLKLNIDTAGKARLVMRSDGLLRVILNLPLVENTTISKGFKSSLASEKFVRITGVEKDIPHQYAVKLKSGDVAAELYEALDGRIETKEDTEPATSKSNSQAPSELDAPSQEPVSTQEVAAPVELETQTETTSTQEDPDTK